ncbi:MAG TPA: PPC domain-containing protein [Verrucomicrobiae bacterium]
MSLAALSAVLLFNLSLVANAQTLINGANQTGTIFTNTVADSYTFTANAGDSINVRLGTTGFNGKLQLYAPNSALLATAQAGTDNLITDTATASGTYTVLVSSSTAHGTGTYVLNLAQIPESFIVPLGDQGGPMINGGAYPGIITLGDQDMWTFTANAGDSISVRLGTTNFYGRVQLYGPNGALLATAQNQSSDNLITETATSSGTFTVLVSVFYDPGYNNGVDGIGTYVLSLAQAPESFIVSPGYQGGPMTNGGAYPGTIPIGDQQMWSFPANKGDNISVRLGTSGFYGRVQLFGPNGASLALVQGQSTDNLITETATNSGTFTVLVSAYYDPGYRGGVEGTGTYVLSLAQFPEPFIVPAGDDGGTLTNGANATGTITLGDQDMWSFTANKGDSINLRVGATGFDGWLKLYGPNGALLATGGSGYVDALVAYTATNSGTFTVVVSSYYLNGTGTYVLNLAQAPEPYIVPAGDEGGPMAGVTKYYGTITLGDLDMWSFTACQGDLISLQLNTTNVDGYLELYGPNGTLLKTAGSSTVSSITYTATNCGNFTILVSSWYLNGAGTYGLTVNGLEDTMRVCFPVISGASLTVNGVGGPTNAVFVLYTTTNVATPFGLWIPVLTNQFDQFGVFGYTNIYNPAQRQQFYRFSVP